MRPVYGRDVVRAVQQKNRRQSMSGTNASPKGRSHQSMRRYLIAILILSASTVLAQKKWTPPKTPWGDPDLQGVWNDATSTPLERPNGLASKGVLADEEAAEFAEQLANNLSRDRRDGG